MASSTPDSGWGILPEGVTLSDIGHGALDVVGWVPGYGEAADLANAAWYAGEEQYLEAGLSLISMVPWVGDAIGKGGKYAGKLSGPALKQLSRALQKIDFASFLRPLLNHPTIGPKLGEIVGALENWRGRIVTRARKSMEPCPKALLNIDADGWTGNVMESATGRKMVAQFEAEGNTRAVARSKAQQAMESGMEEAVRFKVVAGEKLYKLTADGTSPMSPYWMTKTELDTLKGLSPSQIADRLGLPPGSIPRDGGPFLVQSITAKTNYTGFQSTIAPVANGAYKGGGGGTQILVPARGNFTPASPATVFR